MEIVKKVIQKFVGASENRGKADTCMLLNIKLLSGVCNHFLLPLIRLEEVAEAIINYQCTSGGTEIRRMYFCYISFFQRLRQQRLSFV